MSQDAAIQQWRSLEYGMFIHFGPNTFSGQAWGDGKFPAADFQPSRWNPDAWAEIAERAGMRYAVLTSKHHDGFCLWPTQLTDYSVKNSPGARDYFGEFAEAFRRRGLAVGVYYSLWDLNCPCYDDDAQYAAFMRGQLTELLTGYGDICEVWFDGAWDKESAERTWQAEARAYLRGGIDLSGARWEWDRLYNTIKELQPGCMVANNSSSVRRGAIRYLPVDVRTAEHFDFVFDGQPCPVLDESEVVDADGKTWQLPLEYETTLNPAWFYSANSHYIPPAPATVAHWRARAQAEDANLLLNVGPDTTGTIPAYEAAILIEAENEFAGAGELSHKT